MFLTGVAVCRHSKQINVGPEKEIDGLLYENKNVIATMLAINRS